MKMICNYLYLIKKITTTQKVNGLLYYAKMIPWIGKKIPDAWYASSTVKNVISIIWLLGSFLFTFVSKIIYIGVMFILPISMLAKPGTESFLFVWIFFWLSGFAGPLLSNATTQPQKREYVMISLMHMNPRRYVFAQWIWHYGVESVLLGIVLLLFCLMSSLPLWYVIGLMLGFVTLHFCGEMIHIHYFSTHEKPLSSKYAFTIVLFVLLYGIAYGGIYFFTNPPFSETWLVIVMALSSLACFFVLPYLFRVDYSTLMRKGIAMNRNIYDGSIYKQNNQAAVELKDQDYQEEELREHKYERFHGYEYLNALFFQRHKRLFFRPMRRRIIGILVGFCLLDLFVIFAKPDLQAIQQPLTILPATIFLLYFISIGERVTRAMFYNCDNSLLHYGYYRQADAILTNFKIRLRKIIAMNCLLATLLSLGYGSFVWLAWQSGFTMLDHFIFIASIFSVSIFFSIHHLFLYYILQPYTGELEMRSPMFGVINSVVYFICYMLSQLEGTRLLAILILLVTILYSLLALFLVKRLAPKNFHIR